MGSLSIWHWLIVLLVVVLIFGTKKLRNIGQDPTDPAKFAPAARRLTVIRAQTFGAQTMDAIALDAVEKALAAYL